MFKCERCGSEFSPLRVPLNEKCPRCRARDGLSVPLTFAPFSAATPEGEVTGSETVSDSRGEEADEAR